MGARKLAINCSQFNCHGEINQKLTTNGLQNELHLVEGASQGEADLLLIDTHSSEKFQNLNNGQIILLIGNDLKKLSLEIERLRPQHIFFNSESGGEVINFTDILWACQKSGALTPESLLNFPCKIVSDKLRSSKEMEQTIQKVLDQTDLSNFFSQGRSHLELLINELLTNALYNAPENIVGNEFIQLSKERKAVVLPDSLRITLQTFSNEKELSIVVTDPFGTLNPDTIYRYITRGLGSSIVHENKQGGAGMGISLMRNFCHRLAFNVIPNQSTQVICYIEKKKRHKDHELRFKSMHIFLGSKL